MIDDDLRYELKLTCEARWLAQAQLWLRLHPQGFRQEHPARTVSNIYLDTINQAYFRANQAGLSNRRKLRLRWYEELPGPGQGPALPVMAPVLELKYKQNMLGGKKRLALPAPIDLARPWAAILAGISALAPDDWRPVLEEANRPALINSYRREYYVTGDGGIRATLDYRQRAFDQRLALRPNLQVKLPLADVVVIEIKGDRQEEVRLLDVASHFPIPRSRHSKYASGILAAAYTE